MSVYFVVFSALQAFAHASSQDDPQVISFPSSQPSNAATVRADFVGLGFDNAFLNDYTNDFSANLINSVAARMSVPPILRIGGTSNDRTHYDPNQKEATKCTAGPCPWGAGATFTVGPSFFDGFKAFAKYPMTIQAPMSKNLNVSNSVAYVQKAYEALGADRTAAIALGNEVQGYEDTADAYVQGALKLENAIVKKLNFSDGRIFEVLDLASGKIDGKWNLADAFKAGLDSNKQVKVAAEHYYQIDNQNPSQPQTLQRGLMNHTKITTKFQDYDQALTYLKAHNPNIPFILSETGSALGTATESFNSAFGAALWAIDFKLYSMSRGVARVHGTQRPQAPHSLWVPVANVTNSPGPQVRAPFYAEPFVADFVGKSGAKVGAVNMDLASDFLTAYAAYEDGKLARVALLNMKEWKRGDGGRGVTQFKVKTDASRVKVVRLQAEEGTLAGGFDVDGRNITYGGVQWAKGLGNGRDFGTGRVDEVVVRGGEAVVEVAESEGVVVHLG